MEKKEGITSKDTTCKFLIENTANKIQKAVLFGFDRNFLQPNFGSEDGIKVTLIDSKKTYFNLLESISDKVLTIDLIKVKSKNTNQVTKIITIDEVDYNAHRLIVPIVTQSFVLNTPKSHDLLNEEGLLYVDCNLEVNRGLMIEIDILPKTKVEYWFI